MSEGAIVAFFFTFALASIVYMYRHHDSQLGALSHSRDCIWTFARSACSSPPEGCGDVEFLDGLRPSGVDSAVLEQADGLAGALGDASAFAHKMMDGLHLVGYQVSAEAGSEARRPSMLGGGVATRTAKHAFFCNEKMQTPLELMKDAFCRVTNAEVLGC